MVVDRAEYLAWLTTLNPNQLRAEENNLTMMTSGIMSRHTKSVAEFKLKIVRQIMNNR